MVLRKPCRGRGFVKVAVTSAAIFNIVFIGFVSRYTYLKPQETKLSFSLSNIEKKDEQIKSRNESKSTSVRKVTSIGGTGSFLIPDDETLRKLTEAEQLTMYWKYINTVQVLCKNQTRVGKLDDGGKEVCTDDGYKPSKPCIVYSFGSNYQFDFDVPMNKFYGCDVFTYDPSMNYGGRKIPPEIKFELRGLAEKNYINEKNWKLSTLQQIVLDNNHENRLIDILKIDVEGAEWKSIPPAIESGVIKRVKQILIELHASRMGPNMDKGFWGDVDLAGQLRVLRMLYESGFRIFMREHNMFSITDFAVPPEDKITIRLIDILKIDVEGAEWKSIPPAIESGVIKRVKQILIELHASRMGPNMDKGFWGDVDLAGQLRVLRMLYESGFRIFMREHNMFSITDFAVPPEDKITIVNEISLININFQEKSTKR